MRRASLTVSSEQQGLSGNFAVVAEELHRGADDVVALLDEHRRGDR